VDKSRGVARGGAADPRGAPKGVENFF
jgi:hypothetical protein